jgi:hypothetical protein
VSDQVGGLKTAVLDAVELLEEGWPEKASQTKDGDQ